MLLKFRCQANSCSFEDMFPAPFKCFESFLYPLCSEIDVDVIGMDLFSFIRFIFLCSGKFSVFLLNNILPFIFFGDDIGQLLDFLF